jgi:hypothetical protein
LENRLEHCVRLIQDFVIPEAQHTKPLRFEESSSCRVRDFAVLATVYLDHEPCSVAVEVEGVRRHGVLPAESESGESRATKLKPQLALGVGHFPAQGARLF